MVLKEQGQGRVYSDGGETERRMLDIARGYPEDLSQDYIADDSSYSVNNTFSAVRQNILNWYPFKKGARILEVGAGMGAITGMLCDRAAHVTALEMGEARAEVIRARYAGRENLDVVVGDVNGWEADQGYDYAVLVGVLEYAAIFSDARDPYVEFLRNVKRHLKDGGVMLLAIENRFGLKYWLGASEDHLQEPFAGLFGYADKKGPRTFSRAELSSMLERSGFRHARFYSVLPDYRFPELIFADGYAPDAMNLKKVTFTYAKGSMLSGDERQLYKELVDNGTFPFFANSFLVEASVGELAGRRALHVSAKGEVYQEYRVSTVAYDDGYVYKAPMHPNARAHVQGILENTRYLMGRGIAVLPYEEDGDAIRCRWHAGANAQEVFRQALAGDDRGTLDGLIGCLRGCYERSSETAAYNKNNLIQKSHLGDEGIDYGTILQKAFIDMTFYNAFYEGGTLLFYDQEWCLERVPLNFCMYYAIKSAYSRAGVETGIAFGELLESAGIREAEVSAYERLEPFIWSHVLYRQTDFYGADGYCNRYGRQLLWKERQARDQDRIASLEREKGQACSQAESRRLQVERHAEAERGLRKELADERGRAKGLQQELADERGRAKGLQQELRNKQGHIELLLEPERELARIKGSRTWRVAGGLQKASSAIAPPGSARRLMLKMAVKLACHPKQSLRMLKPAKIRNFLRLLREEGAASVSSRMDMSMPDLSKKAEKSTMPANAVRTGKAFEEYSALVFDRAEEPEVSIIIPAFNQFAYTYSCLESILKNTGGGVKYEVILADDCSTDGTARLQEIVGNATVIRNKENLRFLKNCNHAAKAARGKYVLFLNNDTQVQEGWLEPLVRLMEGDGGIGMAGSKLIYPDGRLQEAGGIVWDDGSAWNYGHGQDPGRPEYNYVKDVDYISGASLMVRKGLWDEIGGFDERYAPAYCEDSDLAFEVRRRGYRVVYQPQSVVMHFEGLSNGTDPASGVKGHQEGNSRKLAQKWGAQLKGHYPNGKGVFRARERSRRKPIVLFIDHYVPQYDQDAGSRTVWQYVRMLAGKGFQVKFIGDNFYRHEPYTTEMEQLGVEVLCGEYYATHIFKWLDANHKDIDFVFMNRPHISIKYIDYFYGRTKAKIIYYGHDLHFLRCQREHALTGDQAKRREAEEWKRQELYLMERATVSYYPSCVEVGEVHKIRADLPVKAVTAYVYGDFMEGLQLDFSKRDGILFVGGFVHGPNKDAVRWFVDEILPYIRKGQGMPFYIVGSHVTREIQGLDGKDGICVKGHVTDGELRGLYQKCRVAVVPLRYGAGVKGKVVEALYHGMPVVTTSVGAEGLPDAEKVMRVQDTPQGFARDVLALYGDCGRLREMAQGTQGYVREHFSVGAAWEGIAEDFRWHGKTM